MAEGSNKPPQDDASLTKQVGMLAGLGFEFIASVLLPGALGYWLDRKFGTSPWLMLVGGAFGFAAGLYRMILASRAAMR